MVDGILPRAADGVDSMEEQRRMFFVGMTRSKKNLFLLSTIRWDAKHVHKLGSAKFSPVYHGGRLYNAMTSPFIAELKL
jgi:superfamily I DNA/RNA helicase